MQEGTELRVKKIENGFLITTEAERDHAAANFDDLTGKLNRLFDVAGEFYANNSQAEHVSHANQIINSQRDEIGSLRVAKQELERNLDGARLRLTATTDNLNRELQRSDELRIKIGELQAKLDKKK